MKRLNNKGYLTVEIILAAVIAFTIAFFLIEITVNFSNASDDYYVDTIFLTDKSLIIDNIKKRIQTDINDKGIITDIDCSNNKCTIIYENGDSKDITYNANNELVYNDYKKEIKNVSFKSINVSNSFDENDYIRIVISFDNNLTNNNYDINILILNSVEPIIEEEEIVSLEPISEYITNLYMNNKDKVVVNNNIQYQYATSVNLMNDRSGGTTTSLDDGNIRYYGKDPNNYIDIGDRFNNKPWNKFSIFNGMFETSEECYQAADCNTNYEEIGNLAIGEPFVSADQCNKYMPNMLSNIGASSIDEICREEPIRYRIIGVFDGKIKIVRNLYFSSAWDTSAASINSGQGVNEWSQADMMKLLNPGYEQNKGQVCSNCKYGSFFSFSCETCSDNEYVNNSLWWNSQSGKCYDNQKNSTSDCNFEVNGLSLKPKEYIVENDWYTGIAIESHYPNELYHDERNNIQQFPADGVLRTIKWTGKVGLINISDFAYASDLGKCNLPLLDYTCSNNECGKENWLGFGGLATTINKNSDAGSIWKTTPGTADCSSNKTYSSNAVYWLNFVNPTFYLKSTTELTGGDGTINNPYTIK